MVPKQIPVNENLLQVVQYPEAGQPILRIENALDDFENGRMETHWHPEFLFTLLIRGELDYCLHRGKEPAVHYRMGVGDGIFVNSNVLHGCVQRVPGTVVFTFGMPPGLFTAPLFGTLFQRKVLPLIHSGILGVYLSAASMEDQPLLELFRAFRNLSPEDGSLELRTMELVCRIWEELFVKLGRAKDQVFYQSINAAQIGRIQSMIDFIREHYQESITVDQIAHAGQMSRRECFRKFRSALDQSPMEFLTQFRVLKAAYLLSTTDLSLTEISSSCGFESVSYFTKQFRKRYTVSPKQIRP